MIDPNKYPEAPPPECRECGDTGFIEEHHEGDPEGTTRARRCPCVKVRWYEKHIDELDRENVRFQGLTLQTYEPENAAQSAALQNCKLWAEAWPDVERGILLMGPVGVGKTGLLWATAKAAGLKEFELPHILRALDLAEAPIYRDHSKPDERTRNEIIGFSLRRRLFIFDDLGTGKRSESADGAYFRLLDKRHLACLPTLVTTNFTDHVIQAVDGGTIETCESRIGGRLYSRLRQSCDFYDMTGADRRRKE